MDVGRIQPSARLRRWLKSSLLVALGGLMAVVSAEAVLRAYAHVPRVLDPDFGYVATGTAHWYREGHGVSHWLEHGIRAPSAPVPAPKARVLVIGDSFTQAVHVTDDEVYTDVAERLLLEQGFPSSVLNAGASGRTLAYYVHLAPSYRRVFEPDWTVVQLNDDDLLSAAFNRGDTHFVAQSDGSLAVKALPPEGRGGPLRKALRYVRANSALLEMSVLQYRGFEALARQVRPFRQGQPAPPRRADAPENFPIRAELEALAKAYDRRVTVLVLSAWIPDRATVPTPTELAIREACTALGLSCAFTRDANLHVREQGRFPTGFPNTKPHSGHLNAWGHRAAAETLVRELTDGPLHALF